MKFLLNEPSFLNVSKIIIEPLLQLNIHHLLRLKKGIFEEIGDGENFGAFFKRLQLVVQVAAL